MKQTHLVTLLGSILLTMIGCDKHESHGKTVGEPSKLASTAATSVAPSSAAPTGAPAPPSSAAPVGASAEPAAAPGQPTALSCDEAEARGDELEGKPVIVTAISWGVGKLKTGGKRLELGARPLTGFQQAHLVADFPGPDFTQLDALPKDAKVRLRCVMGPKKYGARKLHDCTILP